MKPIILFLVIFISSATLSTFSSAKETEGKIKVPGGFVWYRIEGQPDKTPLLFIHGGPGGNSCALLPLKKLGHDRHIIFYDQLGAGRSEQPDDLSLWNIQRFVDELDAVRKSLGLNKVNLLAHSWGAAIAAQYLVDKGSEGIASVIFVGPYLSSQDWTQGTNELRKQLKPETQAILKKHEIDGTTNSAEYQRASEEFYRLFLFRHPHPEPEECKNSAWSPVIYETMWGNSEFLTTGNLKDFDIAKRLNNIKIPTLFLIGEFDEARESTMRKYQQQIPKSEVIVIKDAAHMSMIDQPNQFIKEVSTFLQKVDAQTTAK